ncbi:hypothetical protein [Agromyces aureus]|uniref:HK97 gp10 family phage protein n=1 Tax=Agromyces aureus TaxID=453304 RepID=A0A191WF15_9MICO|nr:hypothetical protein [Agromyces aureus]ANJ26817.1 hypothetical protein ATC03_08895 [Agromyces aureus]
MSIDFDFSELNTFAVEIEQADRKLAGNVVKAVRTSAFRGRRAWQKSAEGNSRTHLRGYPAAVDYDDVKNDGGSIGTDLGPNLSKGQGPLGFVEDAPGGVNAAPQRNYLAAEKVIEKDLVVGVLKAVDDSLGGV